MHESARQGNSDFQGNTSTYVNSWEDVMRENKKETEPKTNNYKKKNNDYTNNQSNTKTTSTDKTSTNMRGGRKTKISRTGSHLFEEYLTSKGRGQYEDTEYSHRKSRIERVHIGTSGKGGIKVSKGGRGGMIGMMLGVTAIGLGMYFTSKKRDYGKKYK